MWIKYCILIICLLEQILVRRCQCKWLNSLMHQLTINVKPYEVMIFINSSVETTSAQNIVFQRIMEELPSIVIDLATYTLEYENQFSNFPTVTRKKNAILHLILHQEVNNWQYFLDVFVNISQKYPLLKCLTIYFEDNSITDDMLHLSFRYSWTSKVLDFTVLKISSDKEFVYNFNPFFNILNKSQFDSEVEIFPYKLHNLNGYQLKLVDLNFSQHRSTLRYIFHINIIEMMAKIMNFSFSFTVTMNDKDASNLVELTNECLKNGSADMIPVPLSSRFFTKVNIEDVGFDCLQYVALVPVISTREFYTSAGVVFLMFIIPIVVVVLSNITNALKITSNYFQTFQILQVLLGIPISSNMLNCADKIVFLTFIAISMYYVNVFYYEILSVHLINSEKPFDTIEDLENSQFPVSAHEIIRRIILSSNKDEKIQNLMKKAVNDSTHIRNGDCISALRDYSKVICFLPRWLAESSVNKYRDINGNPRMKIAKPIFSCDKMYYTFTYRFPLIERFYEIFARMHESESWRLQGFRQDFNKTDGQADENKKKEKHQLSMQLLWTMIIGLLLSTVVLLAELIFHRNSFLRCK